MKTNNSTLERITLKKEKTDFKRVKITTSKESEEVIRQFYFDDIEIYESVFILLLNRSNNTIGYAKISQGGTAGSVVDVKIIAKFAIEGLASNVILAHNHPSGNTQPSQADKTITEKVKNALKLFDILLMDHVILTKDNYYSFSYNGIL